MKRRLSIENEQAFRELIDHIAAIKDSETLRRLMDEVLTPSERRDIALRWRLMTLLTEGLPQRQIAKTLGISLCKITRGSSVLKQPQSVSRDLLGEIPPPRRTRKTRKKTNL
jgi:TrpR family trp operon transcriptional repressor